jgi:hypothetical protein
MTKGIKFDEEKTQWHLLPMDVMEIVVRVLMHGAKKYAPDNWKYVEPKERYYDAAMRHLTARHQGQQLDNGPGGSGLPHLACAICCLIFYLWKDTHENSLRRRGLFSR